MSSGIATSWPSTATITSPSSIPAAPAGPSVVVATDVGALIDGEVLLDRQVAVDVVASRPPGRRCGASGSLSAMDDRVLRRVDRDREPDVLGLIVAGGVDADHPALHVDAAGRPSSRG